MQHISARSVKNWVLYKKMLHDRRDFAGRAFNMKVPFTPLTDEQRQDVEQYWNSILSASKRKFKYNKRWFEFFNSFCDDKSKLKYYIPDDFYFCYIDAHYSHPYLATYFDDKNYYDLYFHDVKQPLTIGRIADGTLLDAGYNLIGMNDLLNLCAKNGKVIVKNAVESSGGKGIKFWSADEPTEKLEAIIKERKDAIIQDVISQHDTLNLLHKDSINSIRITSLLRGEEVKILSSVCRMGVNGANVDNATSGGIFCGIKDDGNLREVAYNIKGERFDRHPQGAEFGKIKLPGIDKCKAEIYRLMPRLVRLTRIVSWDFAIDKEGEPVMIEANLTYGGVDFHQICNGPILGDMTTEILKEIVAVEPNVY